MKALSSFQVVWRPTKIKVFLRRSMSGFFVLLLLFGASELAAIGFVEKAQAAAKQSKGLDVPKQNKEVTETGIAGPALNKDNKMLPSPEQLKNYQFEEKELLDKRSQYKDVKQNKDGTQTETTYFAPKYYKTDKAWEPINTDLIEDTNAADGGAIASAFGKVQSIFKGKSTYKVKANDWQAKFAPTNDKKGMIRVNIAYEEISYHPVGAKNVAPSITYDSNGRQHINYYDVWPGVNLEYLVNSDSVKLNIVLKDKNATNNIGFRVEGASFKADPNNPTTYISEKGTIISPVNLVLNNYGPVTENVYGQSFSNKELRIWANKDFLEKVPEDAFPAVIDPSSSGSRFSGTREGGSYVSFKSDGYVCPSNICNIYSGSLLDAGNVWRSWRGMAQFPYSDLGGYYVTAANLHLTQLTGVSFWTGNYNAHSYAAYTGSCWNYACASAPTSPGWYSFGTVGDINVTEIYRQAINANDLSRWVMILGEECACSTFKNFDPIGTYVTITYAQKSATPTSVLPADNQVLVTDQPTLSVNPVTVSTAGDSVKYYFRVSTNPDAETGTVFNSGWIDSPSWTLPEGALQDGMKYYWHAYTSTWNGANFIYQATPNAVRSFKIDLRNGKDKTQSYDDAGPISVNLATGNATTSASTHSMNALGGNIAVGLEYNSPKRSKPGLQADYYPNNNYSGNTSVSRVEQRLDNNWGYASPSAGVLPVDNFSAIYTGYFIAPKTGSYQFGGTNDDQMYIRKNDASQQDLYSNTGCAASACYGASVSLNEGDVLPIKIYYVEYGGLAYNKLMVKGAVAEQVIPTEMLRTPLRSMVQGKGLKAYYFADNGSHTLPSDTNTAFASRTESKIGFNWGSGSPIPTGNTDNWIASFDGTITVPTTGTYNFGTVADDAARVWVNGQLVVNDWAHDGLVSTMWGGAGTSSVNLTAGTSVSIHAEYYEIGGGASFYLYARGAVAEQEVPAAWLGGKARVLPDGWDLSLDADGNLRYDYLTTRPNSVLLQSADGTTDEYTWTGAGYKPPTDKYGILVKNPDGSFTLQDDDGRTYVFNVDGSLRESTVPTDDRKPAALKYSYSGLPAKLDRVTDGVDSSRYGQLLYYGNAQCAQSPSGFDAAPPYNMLCGFATSDGDKTSFFYKNGQLARIELPGGSITDIGYDSDGRIVSQRTPLAYDVVNSGVRADDASVTTQISYDSIGRVNKVTEPSSNAGDTRREHTYTYQPSLLAPLTRLYQPSGPTTHILTNASSLPNVSQTDVWTFGYVLKTQLPGTQPILQCQRPNGSYFSTAVANCYGSPYVFKSILGYVYSAPTSDANVPVSRLGNSSGYTLEFPATSLSGWTTQEIIGYAFPTQYNAGLTDLQTSNSSQPNGYTNKVEFDSLYRTTKDYDKAGNVSITEYDPIKDLVLSSTSATGLKSTTIYDENDLPTDSYGPAPKEWFGADRKPIAAYTAQVPRSETKYDEGITGPSVAWYDVKGETLFGAPKYHSTGTSPGSNRVAYDALKPFSPSSGMSGIGFRATGKIKFPGSGTYNFTGSVDGLSDGYRLIINDTLLINKVTTNTVRDYVNVPFTAVANKAYDITIEYLDTNNDGHMATFVQGPGLPVQASYVEWNGLVKPQYNLTTSTKVYDSQLGDVQSIVNFGSRPELGLAQSSTIDPTGLNLTNQASYEPQTAPNSYLRQTSRSLPGGNTTNYSYYGATELQPNPCVAGSPAVSQAGFAKLTTEQDPDAAGAQVSRTKEVRYDAKGRAIATRMNGDPWTCVTYDTRGRKTKVVQPDINGRLGRTIEYFYEISGNPLKAKVVDSVAGSAESEIDLLGRQISSKDVWGNTYSVSYDANGRVASSTSPVGVESGDYDVLDRPTNYKLNGVVLASMTYDSFSRVTTIEYPEAKDAAGNKLKLAQIKRDNMQRAYGSVYQLSSAKTFDETTTLTQSGKIVGATQVYDGQTLTSSYVLDKLGRMTSATVGQTKFDYGYGAPSASCSSLLGNNVNAHKDSNRTSYTITNLTNSSSQTTTNCYDLADKLISSTDAQIGSPTYDDHGNTTSLAGSGTPINFSYNASDQNTKIEQGNNKIEYVRAGSTILRKKEYVNSTLTKSYRYVSGGRILQSCSLTDDSSCTTLDTYISLPGGITLTKSPTNPDTLKQSTYTLKNFHGDTTLTLTSEGQTDSSLDPVTNQPNCPSCNTLKASGPFGESLIPGTLGASTNYGSSSNNSNTYSTNASDSSMSWAVNPTRKDQSQSTDSNNNPTQLFTVPIIQMGARLYLPTLGRFLSVDPIEGGTLNPYVYAHDPVNGNDYLGLFCLQACSDVAAYLQPAAPATVLRSTTSSVIVSTPRKSYSATPVKVASQKSPSTVYVGAIAGGLSVADNLTDGIGLQSSVFGRELRAGSSIAAKNLKSVSELANNSVVKVVGKYGGPIAVGLEFTGNYLEGDSIGRNVLKTGGGAVLGAVGATAGAIGCGLVSGISFGFLAPVVCPTLVVSGGAVGSWAGSRLGDLGADTLNW